METKNLDLVLSRPGVYVAAGGPAFLFIEVDLQGKCHQLTPHDFKRDGELSRDGWRADRAPTFYGPLARVDLLQQALAVIQISGPLPGREDAWAAAVNMLAASIP